MVGPKLKPRQSDTSMLLITVTVDLPVKRETQEKKTLAAEVEHVRDKLCILGQRGAKSRKYSWP